MVSSVTLASGLEIKVGVGSYVRPDNWAIGDLLIAGDSFSTYRLATHCGGPITSVAVEVEITGRTLQRRGSNRHIRVKITFVGDGEPDVVSGGWLLVPW